MNISLSGETTRSRPTGSGSLWEALFASFTGAWAGAFVASAGSVGSVLINALLTGSATYAVALNQVSWGIVGACLGALIWAVQTCRISRKQNLRWVWLALIGCLVFPVASFAMAGVFRSTLHLIPVFLMPVVIVVFGLVAGRLCMVRLRSAATEIGGTKVPVSVIAAFLVGTFLLLHGVLPSRLRMPGPVYWEILAGLVLLGWGWHLSRPTQRGLGGDEVWSEEGTSGKRLLSWLTYPLQGRSLIILGLSLVVIGTFMPWRMAVFPIILGDSSPAEQGLGRLGPKWMHGISGIAPGYLGKFGDNGGLLVLGLAVGAGWLCVGPSNRLRLGAYWKLIYSGSLLALSAWHAASFGLFRLVQLKLDSTASTILPWELIIDPHGSVFRWRNSMCGTIGPGLLMVLIGAGLICWVVFSRPKTRLTALESG